MTNKALPDQKTLWQLLDYAPSTGIFTWKARPPEAFLHCSRDHEWVARIWNTNWAGKEAFSRRAHGYRAGCVCGKHIYAHRAAFAMMTGEWPKHQIDHINGDRSDNRWENLRAVTQSENSRNAARSSRNTSGFTGVSWDKQKGIWVAYIYPRRKTRIYLGGFHCKEDAINARKVAEITFGYHRNHNRPAVS